jgi:hypothetical protein
MQMYSCTAVPCDPMAADQRVHQNSPAADQRQLVLRELQTQHREVDGPCELAASPCGPCQHTCPVLSIGQ